MIDVGTFNPNLGVTVFGADFVWLGERPDVTVFPALASAFGFVGGTGPSGGVPGTQPPTPGADFLQIGSGVGQPAQGSAELQVVLGNHRTDGFFNFIETHDVYAGRGYVDGGGGGTVWVDDGNTTPSVFFFGVNNDGL